MSPDWLHCSLEILTKLHVIFPMKWRLVTQIYLTYRRTEWKRQYFGDTNPARMRTIRSFRTPCALPRKSSKGLILSHLSSVHSQIRSEGEKMQEFILNYVWLKKPNVFSVLEMNKTMTILKEREKVFSNPAIICCYFIFMNTYLPHR